ncbi:MliC family protein [Chryseobacterium turcicum]|uniref:MliC family protein n=1 Tax=Chryseobacterium turcicum TaxID=2898076 RepID=A0A9Q3V3P8_9FLAO|nr:MliC family protein [Chryseobacterium turcicum]MCD1116509.1 MliC family protein [Chryseobacterium turcicum]
MNKNILAASFVAVLTLAACKKENPASGSSLGTDSIMSSPKDSTHHSISDSLATNQTDSAPEIIKTTISDKDGKKLDMTFDNTKNTVSLVLNGETIELEGQKAASGIWYKNDHYELRGKGNENELHKDGKLIFKSEK